jgi:hypothetical protein
MQVVPFLAAGDGRTSELVLVNPTGSILAGTLQFLDPNGLPLFISTGSGYTWSGEYLIAPNGLQRLVIRDTLAGFGYGAIRVIPYADTPGPSPFLIHNYVENGVTPFEVGVPVTMGAAFRMAAEQLPGQIFTSLSIANPANSGGTVWISLTGFDGNPVASASHHIPGAGMLLGTLESLLPAIANQPIKGVVRITTDLPGGISVAGFRARYNEWRQLLHTTVVPVLENSLRGSEERFFPYLLNGHGFTMDIVLFSGQAGQSSAGTLRFISPDATPLDLQIQGTTPITVTP